MTLAMIWKQTGPVWARSPPRKTPSNPNAAIYPIQAPHIVATHTFAAAPALDILLVPGGMGNRVLHDNNDTTIEDFVAARYQSGELQYLLSVCTGAATLAKSGVLNGRRATTNKAAWSWPIQFGEGIEWVPTARWTEDGNIWTSSGISAGIDMTYAFFRKFLSPAVVDRVINSLEYTPHVDEHWDPYSVVHNVSSIGVVRQYCVSFFPRSDSFNYVLGSRCRYEPLVGRMCRTCWVRFQMLRGASVMAIEGSGSSSSFEECPSVCLMGRNKLLGTSARRPLNTITAC